MKIQQLKKILEAIKNNNQIPAAREIHHIAAAYLMTGKKSSELTDFITWLESLNNIIYRDQLLMLSWYLQLESHLSHDFPVKEIISLGEAYIADPEKFAGFLYWLLERQVTPKEILDTRLLHRYCAYHMCDVITLQKTYGLLNNQTKNTHLFLEYLSRQSCELRGFIDEEQSNGQLRSRNVKGNFFKHVGLLLFRESFWKKKLDDHITFLQHAVKLYALFGDTFVEFLDENIQRHIEISKTLFPNRYVTPVLDPTLENINALFAITRPTPRSRLGIRRPRDPNDSPRFFSRRRLETPITVAEIVAVWIAADPSRR